MGRTYKVGRAYSVRLDGHNEPAQMLSIESDGMNAGGGVMLIANRGDGEIERIVSILNLDLERLCSAAEMAMKIANSDGAEFDIEAELKQLKEVI